MEKSLLIWCCYWHQSRVYTLWRCRYYLCAMPLCLVDIFVIRFNTFLMHFKTMATKTTHTYTPPKTIFRPFKHLFSVRTQCFDSCAHSSSFFIFIFIFCTLTHSLVCVCARHFGENVSVLYPHKPSNIRYLTEK